MTINVAACYEILRLVEETADQARMADEAVRDAAAARLELIDERLRIRQDLLEAIEDLTHYVEWAAIDGRGRPGGTAVADPWVSAADLRSALDRICPEDQP